MAPDPGGQVEPAPRGVPAAGAKAAGVAGGARYPGAVVARLSALGLLRSSVLWGCALGALVASSALGYAAAYKTQAERAHLAIALGSNGGVTALIGAAHQLQGVAGFTQWRSVGVGGLVGAVWGLLVGTRALRGQEDAGRWELLLAGRTSPRRATAQALAGLFGCLGILWAAIASIAAAAGQSPVVHIGVGPALLLALALVSSGAVFLAVGALASQLAATRRQAAAYAGAVLGISYSLRMVADSGAGLGWLRWLTPLGWAEQLQPLTVPYLWALVPIGGSVVVLCVAAVYLGGRRDLGAATFPGRSSAAARTAFLGGPTTLSLRLLRGTAAGWIVGIAAFCALTVGLVAKSGGSTLSGSSELRQAMARLGTTGTGARAYMGLSFVFVTVLVALIAAGQLGAARAEEAQGRLDHVLVRPVSRVRWLAGRLALSCAILTTAGVVAGAFTWLGAASQGSGVGLGRLLAAGLNLVPPAIALLGLGTLALGVWPRLLPAATYGLLAWSFLVEMVGGVVKANHWLLDTSLLHHATAAPAVSPNWGTGAVLVAIGVAGAVAGGFAFARRDLMCE